MDLRELSKCSTRSNQDEKAYNTYPIKYKPYNKTLGLHSMGLRKIF